MGQLILERLNLANSFGPNILCTHSIKVIHDSLGSLGPNVRAIVKFLFSLVKGATETRAFISNLCHCQTTSSSSCSSKTSNKKMKNDFCVSDSETKCNKNSCFTRKCILFSGENTKKNKEKLFYY